MNKIGFTLVFVPFLLISVMNFTDGMEESPEFSPTSMAQIMNIMEALIGTGDFGTWVQVLYGADQLIPISATLFVPSREGLNLTTFDDVDLSLLRYHIVPQRMFMEDLRNLEIGDRIPTLLPNHSLVVTNDSAENFTLNDSPVIHPDIYSDAKITVHGVRDVLNYTLYGDRGRTKIKNTKKAFTSSVGSKNFSAGHLLPVDPPGSSSEANRFAAVFFPSSIAYVFMVLNQELY